MAVKLQRVEHQRYGFRWQGNIKINLWQTVCERGMDWSDSK